MFGIPVKTRLPLAAWIVAALLTFLSTLSHLVGGNAVSVATNEAPPVAHSSDVVKASFVGDHHP